MTITKLKHGGIKKNTEPIPVTEMTNSVADHGKNKMDFIPIEQKYQLLILEELQDIHKLLQERLA